MKILCKSAETADHGLSKPEAILDAATRLFLRNGFAGTSMDMVAREAGVAKQTLYSHFKGKEDLFSALVCRRCRTLFDTLPEKAAAADLGQTLHTLAISFMDMMLDDETLALYRLIITEAPRFPDLSRTYYEAGPEQAIANVALFLTGHGVAEKDSISLAETFLGMLSGPLLTQALLNPDNRPDKPARAKRAREATERFLLMLENL